MMSLHERIPHARDPVRGRALFPAAALFLIAAPAQGPLRVSDPPASQPAATAASGPASQPAAIRPFQPGVLLDWGGRRALVRARVVLREGPLEYFAAFSGKEHESILRIEAAAESIYQGLGLLGYEAGRPVRWNEALQRYDPAEGDLVDVSVRHPLSSDRSRPAFDLVRRLGGPGKPLPRPWVLAGSRRGADGVLLAGLSGAGLALVDAPDALLALTQSHSDSDASLWAEADPAAIPPLGDEVELIFGPPVAPHATFRLAEGGRILATRLPAELEDRASTPLRVEELADLLSLGRRVAPDRRGRIIVPPGNAAASLLKADLERLGLGSTSVEWVERSD
jgi:hypothetical protein